MTANIPFVTLDSRLSHSDDVLFQEVGGEAVLLDLASEQYFGLDPVGTRIWALLGEVSDLQAVRDRLCEEYDAEPAKIESDLIDLANKLAQAGLVKAH